MLRLVSYLLELILLVLKRYEKSRGYNETQEIREEVMSGDAESLSTRIDRMRYDIHKRRESDKTD